MNEFILAIGGNRETRKVIGEALKKHYWGKYNTFCLNGEKATKSYLSKDKDYRLIIMAGGFAWTQEEKVQPKHAITILGYIEAHYRYEKIDRPDIIIYEPDEKYCEDIKNCILQNNVQAEVVGSKEELDLELEYWWAKANANAE